MPAPTLQRHKLFRILTLGGTVLTAGLRHAVAAILCALLGSCGHRSSKTDLLPLSDAHKLRKDVLLSAAPQQMFSVLQAGLRQGRPAQHSRNLLRPLRLFH
jgi:hypothetical protein